MSFLSKRLTIGEYGQLGALQSLVALIWPIINLGLVAGINNSSIRLPKEHSQKLIGLALKIWVVTTFIGLTFAAALQFGGYKFSGISTSNIYLIILCSFGALLNTVASGILRNTFRTSLAVFIEVLGTLLTLGITFSLFEYLNLISVESRLLAVMFGYIPAFIFVLKSAQINPISEPGSFNTATGLIRTGWPLIFHNITGWFTGSMDRVVLLHFHGAEAAGRYTVSSQIGNLLGLLTIVISQVWSPIAARSLNEGNPQKLSNLRKIGLLVAVSLPFFALLFSFFAPFFFKFILSKNYEIDATVVTLISLKCAADGWYYLLVVPYFLFEKNKYLATITVTFGCLSALILWLFGMHLDSTSIALSLLLISVGQVLAIVFNLKKTRFWL